VAKKKLLVAAVAGTIGVLASLLVVAGPTTNLATAQSTFTPELTVTVNGVSSGNSAEYANTEIRVGFSPAPGSNAGCSPSGQLVLVWTIMADGSGSASAAAGMNTPLVNFPSGATERCAYDVLWPQLVKNLQRQSTDARISTAGGAPNAATVTGTYAAVQTRFTPSAAIRVPQVSSGNNPYAGQMISVAFAPTSGPTASCSSSSTSNFAVGNNGSVALVSGSSLPSLIDYPAGRGVRCGYSVTLPASVDALRLQSGASTAVSGTSTAVTADYFSEFSPSVSVVVPQVSSGNSPYAGERASVSFAPVSGSNAGCSSSGTTVVEIDVDGTTLALPAATATLVGRIAGIAQACEYDVTFPDMLGDLVLRAGATATVSPDSSAATATYVTARTDFTPAVSVVVPQVASGNSPYAGRRFSVSFAPVSGSNAGCSSSGTTVVAIGNDGMSSAVSGSVATLVDRPQGVDASCVYSVTFPTATGLVLRSRSTTVSAGSAAIMATYVTARTDFTPSVSVAVPQVVGGDSPYAGMRFSVSFAPVSGSNAGCSSSGTTVVAIGNDGMSSAVSGSVATLVDRPEAVAVSCVYSVTFPSEVGNLNLQQNPAPSATTSASAASPQATYASIPLSNTSSLTLINTSPTATPAMRQQVIVGISTVNQCEAGNRAPISSTFTLSAGGPDATGSVDVVGILSQNCNWEITFRSGDGACMVQARAKRGRVFLGSPETDGSLILSGVGGNGTLFYSGQPVDSLEFMVTTSCSTSFSPAVSVVVPQVASGNSPYAGMRFSVSFAPVARSNAGCSASGTSVVEIGTNGMSSAVADSTARLVNTPVGTSVNCAYAVTFPTEVGALRLQRGATARVSQASSAATATYARIVVQVRVITTYPSDEVFTTRDKVDYFVTVISPCGGYVGAIPRAFGSQGDVASLQVFPGSVTVYSSGLNDILNPASQRTFTVEAFSDAAGTRPCTVQVTERNGPDRCSPVGGAVQSRTYSAGATVLAFEFTHTCTPRVGSGSGNGGSGSGSSSGDSASASNTSTAATPPSLPAFTPRTAGDNGNAVPDGPLPEGAAG